MDEPGLSHVQLTGITVTEKCIEIACTLTDTQTRWPLCGVVCPVVNDRTTRRARDLNISERAVYLLVSVRQFRCSTCGSCPTERRPFAGSAALKTACFLREQFHPILDRPQSVASALTGLDEWVASIRTQQLPLFDGFSGTLQRHKEHIANQVLDHVSNAVTEGLNNLMRSIRCASGMPNFHQLRLRVMAISGEH